MGAQKIYTEIPYRKNALPYPVERDLGKRIFDIFFSSAILFLLSPLLLSIACIIRMTSPGPFFYAQERTTRGGRKFRCLKFRTMYDKADAKLHKLLQENPELQKEWNDYFKLKNDPRVTPFGKFLRKTSLDELPQFWNVLKGDLSVVGPRPVVQEEVIKYFGEKAPKILSIRPGITGVWQVSGRSNISMQERVQIEENYVENRSFFTDLILICKTIPVMLFSKGAY